jgi:hypothetical protein
MDEERQKMNLIVEKEQQEAEGRLSQVRLLAAQADLRQAEADARADGRTMPAE